MKKILFFSTFIICLTLWVCCTGISSTNKKITASYTGNEKCQSCHQQEFKDYLTSNHYHAMDSATSNKVLADFDNTFFVYYGDSSFFYKKGEQFFVRTADSTGTKREFAISYTFGWEPLQQYLVKFDDGRIQTLPFCWDTRTKENGGQRWFHLYGMKKYYPAMNFFGWGTTRTGTICALPATLQTCTKILILKKILLKQPGALTGLPANHVTALQVNI